MRETRHRASHAAEYDHTRRDGHIEGRVAYFRATLQAVSSHADHDRQAETEGRSLIELVRPHLPVEVVVHGPPDAWPLVGPALIARATGTLEAILALLPLDREADANTLLRSLYEHVTTFAWLGADPGEERMRRWLKSDCKARLRMDDDCREVGFPILDTEKRSEFEATVASLASEMPDLLARAKAADAHWAGKVIGLSGSTTATSLRGLYAIAYRRLSAIAHPSNMGLNPVTVPLRGGPNSHSARGAARGHARPLRARTDRLRTRPLRERCDPRVADEGRDRRRVG